MEKVLEFEGCNYFRQRLVLSTLTSKPVRITKIREGTDQPGIKEFEAGFIRLLDKLTNGSRIEVNETGTCLYYKPGLLLGGTLEHDCSRQRSVGYFLEPLILLAPFSKKPIHITLRGITNGPQDPSVDYYRMCVLPVLKKLLPDNGLELKLQSRGVWPEGCGQVLFCCPVVRKMKPLLMVEDGKIRRVRGIAHCVRVNPSMANRMVVAARSVLNKYLPDVYIYTDVVKGAEGGKSPGFGLTLVAESTTGVMHAAESSTYSCTATPTSAAMRGRVGGVTGAGEQPVILPENVGKEVASLLLEEIVKGGCVDSCCQIIPLLFMALGQKDVSKVQLGELSAYSIQFLRYMKEFFQLKYKVTGEEDKLIPPDEGENECGDEMEPLSRLLVTLSCVGVGYSNFNRGDRKSVV